MAKMTYKPPTTTNGDLRIPITFFSKVPTDGFGPGSIKQNELFSTFAEIYNPSMKDLEIMKATETKEALTLRIRDPLQSYQPTNKHFVRIDDFRYPSKEWNIIDIRPDFVDQRFIVILLRGDVDARN
jgi:hypothetical protein